LSSNVYFYFALCNHLQWWKSLAECSVYQVLVLFGKSSASSATSGAGNATDNTLPMFGYITNAVPSGLSVLYVSIYLLEPQH